MTPRLIGTIMLLHQFLSSDGAFLQFDSDSYNPVPGVMEGVPSARNYDGGFASKLMVCRVVHE